MLTARHLTKTYDDRLILDDINIDLAPGKITCLIGPSGSGKTTLLKCLSLIEDADAGVVTMDDTRYDYPRESNTPLNPHPWPRITAVFQALFLWPHLSLRENILLPARNVNRRSDHDLDTLIGEFEMADFIDRYPNEVSGGQRQRAALARALILNPRYVLLDEITSALDVEQTARLLTKLEHLKQRGIGTLLITHHLNFARRAADEIVFMADGKIVEQGPASLLDQPQTPRLRQFLNLVADAS